MHVKHHIIRILSCLILLVCFMVPNCCASTLEGTWFPSDSDMSYYKYPESMTLKPDGSGIVDGFLVAWSEENGIFTIYTMLGSLSFEYRFDGQTLFLDDHPYLQNNNTESKRTLILPNESIWKTSFLDMNELLEADPTSAYISDSNQRFYAYACKESADYNYPGKATYYFLDDKLGCIIFELTKDQCHDYMNYFCEIFEEAYPNPKDSLTSEELASLVLWGCFPQAIGRIYYIWEVYDHYTFSKIWDCSDDTIAAIFYDDERAFAIIASKTESCALWDLLLHEEDILAQKQAEEDQQLMDMIMDSMDGID